MVERFFWELKNIGFCGPYNKQRSERLSQVQMFLLLCGLLHFPFVDAIIV
jgi:hypothetical protein